MMNTLQSCTWNVCAHRLQDSMTSLMLSKPLKFKFFFKKYEYTFATLKYGFGTWSLVAREECILRGCERMELMKILRVSCFVLSLKYGGIIQFDKD
jgi:hypothetical protein